MSTRDQDNFNKLGLNNITSLTGDFKAVIPTLTSNTYDLIYFDGNHQKEATIEYFNMLLPTINNNTIFSLFSLL